MQKWYPSWQNIHFKSFSQKFVAVQTLPVLLENTSEGLCEPILRFFIFKKSNRASHLWFFPQITNSEKFPNLQYKVETDIFRQITVPNIHISFSYFRIYYEIFLILWMSRSLFPCCEIYLQIYTWSKVGRFNNDRAENLVTQPLLKG